MSLQCDVSLGGVSVACYMYMVLHTAFVAYMQCLKKFSPCLLLSVYLNYCCTFQVCDHHSLAQKNPGNMDLADVSVSAVIHRVKTTLNTSFLENILVS